MSKSAKDIFIKTATISLVTTAIGSGIVYSVITNKFNEEIKSVKNEISILKEENKKQPVGLEENNANIEEKGDIQVEKNLDEAKEKSNETKIEESNSTDVLNDVFSIMEKANVELERVNTKITNTGTFSGLQGTFDTLQNYGSQLISISSSLDLSKIGGSETADMISGIGYELQRVSDAPNMADEALNIMGRMGEFTAYIDNNYSK